LLRYREVADAPFPGKLLIVVRISRLALVVQKELGRFAGADGFELARRGGEIEEARQIVLGARIGEIERAFRDAEVKFDEAQVLPKSCRSLLMYAAGV